MIAVSTWLDVVVVATWFYFSNCEWHHCYCLDDRDPSPPEMLEQYYYETQMVEWWVVSVHHSISFTAVVLVWPNWVVFPVLVEWFHRRVDVDE